MWSVITSSLLSLESQFEEERAKRSHGFFSNAYSSTKQEAEGNQQPNVSACLSKVEGSTHLHNHLTLYFVTRTLKVFEILCEHGIYADAQAVQAFKRIEVLK